MQNKNEQKLRELIKKWTDFFKWRKDFDKWQKGRMEQENYQEKEINLFESIIPHLRNKKILDLGSGMGGFLVAMKRKGYNIQGLEPNLDYREITKLRGKKYGLNVEVTAGFGEKMPFSNNQFDFIYCQDVLEHCENPYQFLKESYRILKSEGQMYITVINRFSFKDPHYHLKFINWIPRTVAEKYIIWRGLSKNGYSGKDNQKLSAMHYFTFRQFQKMAKEIKFKVKDLKKYKISHPELINNKRFKKILRLLKPLRISLPIYFLARLCYLSSFSLILKKSN